MTNLEHYKGYIENLIKKGTTPAKVKGRLTTCKSTRCYDCDFGPHAAECRLNILKWYMAEHEEFELNKDERKFCEALNKGFLIRTRSGRVEFHIEAPTVLANGEAVGNGAFSVIVSGVGKPVAAIRAMFPEAKFSFLKIEHGPVSIEELLGTKEA